MSLNPNALIVNAKHKVINRPLFQLFQTYTDSYKYLGHIINSKLKDDPDIMKQTRSVYVRANIIICNFPVLHFVVLYKSYNF